MSKSLEWPGNREQIKCAPTLTSARPCYTAPAQADTHTHTHARLHMCLACAADSQSDEAVAAAAFGKELREQQNVAVVSPERLNEICRVEGKGT